MKRIILFFVLLFTLMACHRTGYVYKNGWVYIGTAAFAFPFKVTITGDLANIAKNDLKILKYKEYAANKEHVYYEGRIIKNADPESFKFIESYDRSHIAIDKNHVYLAGGKILTKADPDSFEIVNEHYVKDKNYVFIRNYYYEIIGADPASFEALSWPYSKDKKDAYCGILPLFVDDITKFEVLPSVENVYSSSSLQLEEFFNGSENARYNREKYETLFASANKTSSVPLINTGRAKTATIDYYGYVAVTDYDPFNLQVYADLTPFGLSRYELRHEDLKRLWDLNMLDNLPKRNIRPWSNKYFKQNTNSIYNVLLYEGTYIIVPTMADKPGSLYYYGYIYICKSIEKDADVYAIGIKDLNVIKKLLELPHEQVLEKDLYERLGFQESL